MNSPLSAVKRYLFLVSTAVMVFANPSIAWTETHEKLRIGALLSKPFTDNLKNNNGSIAVIQSNPIALVDQTTVVNAKRTDRGYLTSIPELARIAELANQGIQPYADNVSELINYPYAVHPYAWGDDQGSYGSASGEYRSITLSNGAKRCISPSQPEGDNFIHYARGGQAVYLKALVYRFTQQTSYAEVIADKLTELSGTYGFGKAFDGSNLCILLLATSIGLWIQAADLISDYPPWNESGKPVFQAWLANTVYPKVSWASRTRKNNWGSAGSLAAAMIADYLIDTSARLEEFVPIRKTLTPAEAYQVHNKLQKRRIRSYWKGDSDCNKWGIRHYGGIPDELRRGNITHCESQWIGVDDMGQVDNVALNYQIKHISHLIFHAEFLLRRADTSLYDLRHQGATLISQAIRFVIDNPVDANRSVDWVESQKGLLFVAYRYYRLAIMREIAQTLSTTKGGGELPYGRFTHSFAENEDPAPPPTTKVENIIPKIYKQ